jgi:uroporphyrin-III C-methyltransferase / precorrin-2 dehydrogenase / sirohydrochlorin ferrochelatase
VAVISQGTLATQTVVEGTLASVSRQLDEVALEPPVLVVIGDVVSLRDRIAWFGEVAEQAHAALS